MSWGCGEAGVRSSISSEIYAEVVAPGSAARREAARLQAERFARVSTTREAAQTGYVHTTDYAPEVSLTIVARRGRWGGAGDKLIGTARLEPAGAMLIEEMIRLWPGSEAARMLADGRAAEIGGFATPPRTDKATVVDAVDAILALVARLAWERGIQRLWLFPRNGLMGLVWARIPDLLPPYRFTRCADVLGWNEESERLRQFRALRLKGLAAWPAIYQIRTEDLAADVARRVALLPMRCEQSNEINRLLLGAMCRARHEHERDEAGSGMARPFTAIEQKWVRSAGMGHVLSEVR